MYFKKPAFCTQNFANFAILITMKNSKILEAFGDPIGSYAGDAPAGAPGMMLDAGSCCQACGMMPTDIEGAGCGCGTTEGAGCSECGMSEGECMCPKADACPRCGMMPMDPAAACECSMSESKKNKGPSKKTAAKILKGTKTFAEKVKKVSGWAEHPEAAAAWMFHKASGKWPSEK